MRQLCKWADRIGSTVRCRSTRQARGVSARTLRRRRAKPTNGSRAQGAIMTTEPRSKVTKSEAAWRGQLTPEQFRVTRQHGTERAFTGPHRNGRTRGTYRCVCCAAPLFRSEAKFESGTGWPSFFAPVEPLRRRGIHRPLVADAAHGGPLCDLRRPSGACLPGRPCPDRAALLHERDGPRARARPGLIR